MVTPYGAIGAPGSVHSMPWTMMIDIAARTTWTKTPHIPAHPLHLHGPRDRRDGKPLILPAFSRTGCHN